MEDRYQVCMNFGMVTLIVRDFPSAHLLHSARAMFTCADGLYLLVLRLLLSPNSCPILAQFTPLPFSHHVRNYP
jgi:hypothetical protein